MSHTYPPAKEFDPVMSEAYFKKSLNAIEDDWTRINLVETLHEGMTHYEAWRYHDHRADSIFKWCNENLQSDWTEFAGKFYFKEESDAFMFALRWMNRDE